MSLDIIGGIFLATALLGALVHTAIYPLLRRRGVVDIPNHRSSHVKPTIRGGGVGIVVALVGGLALGTALLAFGGDVLQMAIWFGLTVLASAALGWVEDVRGLSVGTRLSGQVVIFSGAAMGAMMLSDLSLGMAVIAGLGGVFYVNAANFMDGVNGISGLHGVVVGSYFAAIGVMASHPALIAAGLATSAAFLSFLPWNTPKAHMFMGDVGSYALGASEWGLCVLALTLGAPLPVATAPLAIYAADVVFTLLSRARRRAPLLEAHREHAYQRVQQLAGSHGVSAGLATLATAACAGIGLLGMEGPIVAGWCLPLIFLVVAMYLATPTLLSLRAGADPTGGGR